MCGRFVQYSDPEIYASRYELDTWCDAQPRYNIAPTQQIRAIRPNRDGKRELVHLRWGLVPHWSKGPDSRYSMINARAETVASKPAYRNAFKARRCLIPAEGFYEWRTTPSGKQPYLIRRRDREPFVMAGLWEHWGDSERGVIESCTIIVMEANTLIAPIHDRMPVIVEGQDLAIWLDPDIQDSERVSTLLQPAPETDWTLHPVSREVNSPRNDDAKLLDEVSPAAS